MYKNLLDGLNPVTQTIESGKALAKFLGMKEEFPEIIVLANGARLALSTKKDAYYFVSVDGCTCKGFTYRRTCKHIKGSKPHGQSMAETLRQADANLHRMPYQYRRMVQVTRETTESEEEPVPESQCSKAICKPVSEEERASRIAAAKEKIEDSKRQARELKERQRIAREEAEAEPMSLIHKGGFRPCLEEEDEPKASSSPIAEMLIDAVFPTTTPGEIEYWNQKAKMEA